MPDEEKKTVPIDTSGPDATIDIEETKLPKPTGWRILVLPFKMKEKTKGGLHLAETT